MRAVSARSTLFEGKGGGCSIPNALNFEKLGVKPHNRGLLLNVFALFS